MIHVYLTPFQDSGEFGDEIEISDYVDLSTLGKIKLTLDNTTYDIGVLRYSSMSLKVNNARGLFSDVGNLSSIFRYRRSGTKVRITWEPASPAICGIAVCGEVILSEEVTIFRGILNDETSKMKAGDQMLSFQILSYDSKFSSVLVPYSDLTAEDTLSTILYKTLNQAEITRYLGIDSADIELEVDYAPDDLTWFENKTGKEAIEKILLAANSVIYVVGERVVACGRSAADDVSYHFYGQASDSGNENVYDIDEIRNGQNRIINFVRWEDDDENTYNVDDEPSIDLWGICLQELDFEFITAIEKIQATAESIVAEFADPRKELTLTTVLSDEVLALKFLDKVDIDYPSVLEVRGRYLPRVGITKIDDALSPLPHLLWDFSLDAETKFKIVGMEIDPKEETISFDLREVAAA